MNLVMFVSPISMVSSNLEAQLHNTSLAGVLEN